MVIAGLLSCYCSVNFECVLWINCLISKDIFCLVVNVNDFNTICSSNRCLNFHLNLNNIGMAYNAEMLQNI